MKTKLLKTGLMMGVAALAIGASAVAQETMSADETRVEDVIIVTAQKRAQNIMDVPLSISSIGADEISSRGLVSSEDYLRGMPGVNQISQDEGYGGQTIIIRGLDTGGGSGSQNFGGSGSNVATFFGEAPLTGSGGILGSSVDLKLYDVERVEVLRGPQGTAFGSSSMSGAVRVIPAAPKLDKFEGQVGAGYSVTAGEGSDNYEVNGTVNLPLVKDKLAVRAVAYRLARSGFYKNTAGSDPDFIAAVAAPFGASDFAVDTDNVGSSTVSGARISALLQATEKLKVNLTYVRQETESDGSARATSGKYEQQFLQVAPDHVYRGQKWGMNDTDIDLVNLTANYDLGWGEVVATYSHIESGNQFANDCVASGLPFPCSTGGPVGHTANSGELRLATDFEGPVNILAGVYAEESKDDYRYSFLWSGDPALNIFGGDPIFDYTDLRDLSQTAAFGEVTWEILPDLTLTGGARVYQYDRTTQIEQGGAVIGPTPTYEKVSADKTGSTFRANLSYKPTEDSLVYAAWSQGFRLGKPQAGVPVQLCDTDLDGLIDGTNVSVDSTRDINSDSVDSYELGGKFSGFGRRLSVTTAVFRMDWTDIPVSIQYPSCAYVTTANAGKARSQGIELSANLRITENLLMDFGGSWVDAKLTQDVPLQGLSDGDELPGAPEYNFSFGMENRFTLFDRPTSIRLDTIYLGSFYSALPATPEQKAGDYVELNATAQMAFDKLNVALFARNLTDEDAFINRAGATGLFDGSRMRPRTIGVRLGYDF